MEQISSSFCLQCGRQTVPNQRFCPNCGAKTAASSALSFTPHERNLLSTLGKYDTQPLQFSEERWKLQGDDIPPGFKLRYVLRGHEEAINQIAWSIDGLMLASLSNDNTIRLWNAKTGQLYKTFKRDQDYTVAWWTDEGRNFIPGSTTKVALFWNAEMKQFLQSLSMPTMSLFNVGSPDGRIFAYSSDDLTIELLETETGNTLHTLAGHSRPVNSVGWSSDGHIIASGSDDTTIRIWDVETGQLLHTFSGHSRPVTSVAWLPNDHIIASGSEDSTIHLWEKETGQLIRILEGHTNTVICICFSSDGRLLASKSLDGTIRLWRSDTWDTVAILDEPFYHSNIGLAFYSGAPVLATLSEKGMVICIWDLDLDILLSTLSVTSSVSYTNAKVVLVGDSGVGKSGLGLVLSGQPFAPTESSHGRRVWTFDNREIELDGKRKETRETLLWDLAGQPGYRLIHQLHLNEIAVALVVFDARNETDPFAGVNHWDRALRLAQHIQGSAVPPMKKFLVAARTDRGGSGVSRLRASSLVRELGFDRYFETSAKDGRNITELAEAIREAIDWDVLPKVSSTDLFQHIKAFLVAEKEVGRLLSTIDDLYSTFQKSQVTPARVSDLRTQFEICIGRVESRGLIRRLSFGNLVLLQPELLDAYASALVNAVRDEPDGLGSISEEKVRACDFSMSKDERIPDREQEKLLLIAMIEDLLRYEIALREQGEDGPYLVFPSQSTRENPDIPNPEGKAVIFGFEGPVFNVYATLAVRLSHSEVFKKKDLWKDAVTYIARVGGACGIFLNNIGEGRAELTLFFDEAASEETRFHFEEYVHTHLKRRAIQDSIQRRRIFLCSVCKEPLTDSQVIHRRQRGYNWLDCPVCGERILLLDREERLTATHASLVSEMDRAADTQVERETAKSTVQGKVATGDFDVFLCHNNVNKSEVKEIGERLKDYGILPWLDVWELRPGLPWQRLLEQQIGQIKSAAVFVGKDSIGPWQQMELEAFLREWVNRGCPVIPVLLPDAPHKPELPVFLNGMTWVDFHKQDPDPMEQLIWGITGKQSSLK